MGRTKSRPRPLKKQRKTKFLGLTTPKQRLEKCNIYKLCISKLARIDDPQAKLCKAVLINNTLKNLEKQPDILYNEEESIDHRSKETNSNINIISQPSIENICSHFLRNNNSRLEHHNERTVPKLQSDTAEDTETMSLCDDIISEFLGVPDNSVTNCGQTNLICDNQDKENVEHSQNGNEDRVHEIGGKLVSPYSYSSFLSEVYSITLRKMKYKVEL